MKINGLDGLSTSEVNLELQNGAKFVMYHYCISALIVTLRRNSDICFIRSGESRVSKGLGWSLLTFVLGWWGIPWGPIYTIQSLVVNFRGGKDVTPQVLSSLNASANKSASVAALASAGPR